MHHLQSYNSSGMNLSGSSFVVGVLFAAAIASTAALRSCDSRLRILLPHLFLHCDCIYSDWSEWEQVPNSIGTDVSGTCESGQAFIETRRKMAIGEGCEEQDESRTMCAPTQKDRLILLLGLGAKSTPQPKVKPISILSKFTSGINSSGLISTTPTKLPLRRKRRTRCSHQSQCLQFWDESRGKRSTQEEDSSRLESNKHHAPKHHAPKHHAPKHHDPVPRPFSVSEDGHRFRRQTNKCDPNDNQHVLFVLDTSGSIPMDTFRRMTDVVADLTTLFCKPIEVAVLTFSHKFFLEFCFNCFETDIFGRIKAAEAIRNIPYRGNVAGKVGYTATGGAAKCVCDQLLDSSCGVEFADNTCVDVVFITDGYSNDNNFEICDEVKCLHDHFLNLNTYSLGVGNYDTPSARSELKCIQDSSNDQSLFTFETFEEFFDQLKEVEEELADPANTEHTCTDADGTLQSD
ncbi:uncharacterized protein LOC135347910 isoform X2 [Halichondria panicea]|uniref:uncharacterized protein LOC135347910 isoform X2 n=1 Tax=Halichondria panicea TaxID=6063 RepID=UPI00312BA882